MHNPYAVHSFLRLAAPNLPTRIHEDPILIKHATSADFAKPHIPKQSMEPRKIQIHAGRENVPDVVCTVYRPLGQTRLRHSFARRGPLQRSPGSSSPFSTPARSPLHAAGVCVPVVRDSAGPTRGRPGPITGVFTLQFLLGCVHLPPSLP